MEKILLTLANTNNPLVVIIGLLLLAMFFFCYYILYQFITKQNDKTSNKKNGSGINQEEELSQLKIRIALIEKDIEHLLETQIEIQRKYESISETLNQISSTLVCISTTLKMALEGINKRLDVIENSDGNKRGK